MEKNIHSKPGNLSYHISPGLSFSIIVTKRIIKSAGSKLSLLAVLLSTGFSLSAQSDIRELNLNEAIQLATTHNKNISLSELDEKIALFNYRQTAAVFLPGINLSHTTMVTDNPLNAFGAKLQQRIINPSDFDPQLLNHPSAVTDFMTGIHLQQPLLNIDKLYERRSAYQQVELYQYKTRRSKEYITYLTQQAYLQLQLAYEAKKVMEESLQMVQAIHNFTNDRYQQGLLQKSDVLHAEVQVKTAETSIAEASDNIKNASDFLSVLMGEPVGAMYSTTSFPGVTAEESIADQLSPNRADFKAMEKAIQSYNLLIKSSRMSYLPRLNAFASYQYNDRKIAGFGANAYLAGLQLSWDLFKGTQTRNKILAQTAERDKLSEELSKQKNEAGMELSRTQRQLDLTRYKITQQEKAVQLAAESLRILQNRYNQGLANTTDVLAAQTLLAQQKLLYKQSVYTAHITAAYLQFLTL